MQSREEKRDRIVREINYKDFENEKNLIMREVGYKAFREVVTKTPILVSSGIYGLCSALSNHGFFNANSNHTFNIISWDTLSIAQQTLGTTAVVLLDIVLLYAAYKIGSALRAHNESIEKVTTTSQRSSI